MKQLLKTSNSELSFRLKFNYNNVYSRLRMLLGEKASLFADLSSMSKYTTWYAADEGNYVRLTEAPQAEMPVLSRQLSQILTDVAAELKKSAELADFADELLEVPDTSYIFYRKEGNDYRFVLTGWGCKLTRTAPVDTAGSLVKKLASRYASEPSEKKEVPEIPHNPGGGDIPGGSQPSVNVDIFPSDEKKQKVVNPGGAEVKQEPEKPAGGSSSSGYVPKTEPEKRKAQPVSLRVIDQNNRPIAGEKVAVRVDGRETLKISNENGLVEVGNLPVYQMFSVSFPDVKGLMERSFEVEADVEVYDAHVYKAIKYSPLLFVEDQHGNHVRNRNIKIMMDGQERVYNSGGDGTIQLPMMQDGQKFVAIDTANYANTEEFEVNQANAKAPYHFRIRLPEQVKVGITILDRSKKPVPNVWISMDSQTKPCQQKTDANGRAEFPADVFETGVVPLNIRMKGRSLIRHELRYTPNTSEYAIQVTDKKPLLAFNWKWLGILPLLALLAWGGYALLNKKPTWEELNKGVVFLRNEVIYVASTGMPENTPYSTLFFAYDQNSRQLGKNSWNAQDIPSIVSVHEGTGFFLSKDGLIATNRHVANPIAPEEYIIASLKAAFVSWQDIAQQKMSFFQHMLNTDAGPKALFQDSLNYYLNYYNYLEKIIKLANYKVRTICNTYAAFDNSIIQNLLPSSDPAFHPCTCLAYGEPGDVNSNDVAIIQLNEKEKIVPKDAHIFAVPRKDVFEEGKSYDDYEVWVLGYNKGSALAGERGIHPQHFKGSISSTNQEYLVQYATASLGGSSGSPVLNKDRQLVAINNSGLVNTQIGYGVRTNYLYELLQEVLGNNKKKENKE